MEKMQLKLTASDDEQITKFKTLKNYYDIANLLEVESRYLKYLLYHPKKTHYKIFFIKKKSGNLRKICAPISSLKIIQQKLAHVLYLIYAAKPSTHGFCPNKSIVTNAQLHIKKKYVFNIDIKDFFPSINFGRVYGMFNGWPYGLPSRVSAVLSKICCNDNELPQGAPTSPIISNMICAKLDSKLQELAKRCNITYSRYADDITFSSTSRLPKEIVEFEILDSSVAITTGERLRGVLNNNGFEINNEKVRLKYKTNRQEVTGLTVNEITNTKRRYVKQVRAMLNAWEKYGLKKADEEHFNKFNIKQRNPEFKKASFMQIVEGKISFIKMVKGEKSPVYRKLANRFINLSGKKKLKYFIDPNDEIKAALWVLEDDITGYQGSAFMLSGVGLVTCQHVLSKNIQAFKCEDPSKKYRVSSVLQDKDCDLAILKIDTEDSHYLKAGRSEVIRHGELITIAGFPQYRLGGSLIIIESKVAGFYPRFNFKRILIDKQIVGGNSGGPALNRDNEVIGIVATGAENFETTTKTIEYGIIPIELIFEMLKKSEICI
ncbi:MAG: trypsin-like peptidase domain-containing protein [Candidatus Omnitrophica bacterium]|nr:trypsin-like peptidase domain-containing protein [Candidatus Omnitrophota bacterium]